MLQAIAISSVLQTENVYRVMKYVILKLIVREEKMNNLVVILLFIIYFHIFKYILLYIYYVTFMIS